jgi:DNA-binding response OmpR family regulator
MLMKNFFIPQGQFSPEEWMLRYKVMSLLIIEKEPYKLIDKEHPLLKLLIMKKGEITSAEDIMVSVWDDAFEKDISIDSVKNQIRHLRKKLPDGCIDSIYGKGYMLK